MVKIVSTIGRSWPAHDFHIKVGVTELKALPTHLHSLLHGYLEAGQMAMTPAVDEDPKAQADADAAFARVQLELATQRAAEARLATAVDKSNADATTKGPGKVG